MNLSDQEQQNKFNVSLAQFWTSKGVLSIKAPVINQIQLNFFKFYKAACKRGGGQAVTNNKHWKTIAEELSITNVDNDIANSLKRHYLRYLFAYEQKNYFGRQQQIESPDLLSGRIRKLAKIQQYQTVKQPLKTTSTIQTKSSVYATRQLQRETGENQQNNLILSVQISRQFEKIQKSQQLYYVKKNKIYPTLNEIKRINLGLQSRIGTQVVYALNMLLLYSYNLNTQLIYDEFPNIIQAMQIYTSSIYPPKSKQNLQHLKTITLILRNFCLNPSYLQLLLKSYLFTTLVAMYNTSLDKQCSRNIVQMMNGLVKVGWDCKEIVRQIIDGLQNQNMEDIEIGVDLVRSLVEQRDQSVQGVIVNSLDVFVKLFVTSTPQIRQTVLEIFAYISDLSSGSRLALAKHPYFIQKLIDILTTGVQQYEKLCQLSALTLSNIAAAPGSHSYIKLFEKQLVIIASSDERIGNIAAGILADIDNQ